ncbi:signal peptidase I [Microbulbifer sp. THAF38]|uniref:signal peptidase I n=1 Tax=Microbulbifer sp. THAF38 TaxID=2587856 RepID=UPI001269787D|nr:signal peptidase I [Microbulbifer sp. THAF38]QFT56460.1 Signal peptidase I [Microbulbifer sp. THAF38]
MNINWKPKAWIAILLGVFLQAFTFLYLNRPKLFWLYFLLSVTASIVDWKYQTLFSSAFSIICPVHAFFIVKNYEYSIERTWYSKWWGIPAIYISFFTTVFLTRSFLYEPFLFPSASMQPTIHPGNHIIIQKLGYGTYGTYGFSLASKEITSPEGMQRGKLYAFYPPHKDIIFVKRLIALPGDTVSVKGNNITINGSLLITDKIYETEKMTAYEQQLSGITYRIQRMNLLPSKDMKETVVPEKSYFFMGDNRDNSLDSRYWGYVSSDRIVGEVIHIFE